ncbi:MAG: phosphonopyruvate decarboxylase, partial [Pelagibacterales bacterium]|nr:phosphonopyruvate decarboxylase [Pelagibacterales bacterium]
MVDPEIFYKSLKSRKIDFYAGVPDSLLKYFCFYVSENIKPENHIIAANEGNALSLGI